MVTKKRIFIENALLILLFGLSFLIYYGLSSVFDRSIPYSLILLFPYIIVYTIFLIIANKNKSRFNWKILPILIFLSLSYLLTVYCPNNQIINSSASNIIVIFQNSAKERFSSIFRFYLILSVAFLIFGYYIYSPYKNKFFNIVYFGYLLLCFFGIAYSLIIEKDLYKQLFANSADDLIRIKSFTGNPNSFAAYLLFGIILIVLDEANKPKVYNWILSIIFICFIFVTKSKTCCFFSLVLFACELILLVYSLIKKSKKTTKLRTIITIGFIYFAIAVILKIGLTQDIPYFSKMIESLMHSVKKIGFSSIKGREEIFKTFLKCLTINPIRFIFGYGFNLLYIKDLTISTDDIMGAHNSFLQTWVNGGFILLLVYLFVLIVALIGIIKMFKDKKFLSALTFLLIFSICVSYQFLETVVGVRLNEQSYIFFLFVVTPLIGYKKRLV